MLIKVKVNDEDKYRNNKMMSFCIYDKNLLEKYKAIWTKIEDLKNIEVNALSVYNDRYIKTKITKFANKPFTNVRGLNAPEDDIMWIFYNHFYLFFTLF